jgi:tetratricopeptide (TPR) repeat protein
MPCLETPRSLIFVLLPFFLLSLVLEGCTSTRRELSTEEKIMMDLEVSKNTDQIKKNPQDATAYYERGNLKLFRKDLSGALADFSQAISIDPQNYYAYYGRGNVYLEQNKKAEAKSDYQRFIQLTQGKKETTVISQRRYIFRNFPDLKP